jgi:hypothetical protein
MELISDAPTTGITPPDYVLNKYASEVSIFTHILWAPELLTEPGIKTGPEAFH